MYVCVFVGHGRRSTSFVLGVAKKSEVAICSAGTSLTCPSSFYQAGIRTTAGDPWLCKLQRNKRELPVNTPSPNTQRLLAISPLHSERRQYFFLIVPPQCYWPLLHVQTICFQTYVKFLLRLQNPARFALSRDAVSGDFYWLTSYCCQSWLYMRNIVLQPLKDTLSSLSLASLTSCICELADLAGQKKKEKETSSPRARETHNLNT